MTELTTSQIASKLSKIRLKKLTAKRRREIAINAAKARWANHEKKV